MPAGFIKRIIICTLLMGWLAHAPALASDCCPADGASLSADANPIAGQPPLAARDGAARISALIRRGEAHRRSGHYGDAAADFQQALDSARKEEQPVWAVIAAQSLGYVHYLQFDLKRAEPLLRRALDEAKSLDRPDLIAGCANRLGGVLVQQNYHTEAIARYRFALEQVRRTADPGLEAAVCRNLAAALPDDARAMEMLGAARRAADRVASPDERAQLLLSIASEASQRRGGAGLSYTLLHDVHAWAAETKDGPGGQSTPRRLQMYSRAAGALGALYEDQSRYEAARGLTEAALSAAQTLRSPALMLQWEWQLGRLMKSMGRPEAAIAAYRRAVGHIETIRPGIPIRYQNGASSFRVTLAPIYLELADLLLGQFSHAATDGRQQTLLREARDTLELIKRSELQDYFKDRCVASRSRPIGSLSEKTAVLYPIMQPERLVLLVDIGGRLAAKTVSVTREKLTAGAIRLSRQLRGLSDYEETSRTLHGWLIDPILTILDSHAIDTLVFAPDGALRLVPVAALWDGQRFLAQRYATVTTPGLTLLESDPLPRGDFNALLAGMSEPGPVVLALPQPLWDAFRTAPLDQQVDQNLRGLSIAMDPDQSPAPAVLERRAADVARVKRALALPGVAREIHELAAIIRGQVVLDKDFQLAKFSSEIERRPFSVVHIASHGFFCGSPDQNFIMTYDKLLDMPTLESLIKPKQFAEQPVEMIVLSACQTAEGDDRSPLGLVGMALKSGARSAMGTLWPVSDAAAQHLFPVFYSLLKDPAVSKAEALRQAQCRLMQQDAFRHPFFWSPFILVGNWL